MANNWAFATLAELRLRLGITDTADDALLTALLDLTAGTIESAAGRPLRRCHARTEYFTGGSALIQLDAYPIAHIHSVRESVTRNFETAGEYQELVEGTDFVADPGSGGRYGETGQLRRIGARWAGSLRNPGCIQVVYTGGYKTDAEVALEGGTVELTSAGEVFSCGVLQDASGWSFYNTAGNCYWLIQVSAGGGAIGLLRFATAGRVLPSWRLLTVQLRCGMKQDGGDCYVGAYVLSACDPMTGTANELYEAAAACGVTERLGSLVMVSHVVDYGAVNFYAGADELSLMQADLVNGALAFAVRNESAVACYLADHEYADPTKRPALIIRHRPLAVDSYDVPDDLRNANLLQAVHEYQTRRTPGMISQATRGTILPSGSSFLKTAADLLPEVQRIAMGYRRLI